MSEKWILIGIIGILCIIICCLLICMMQYRKQVQSFVQCTRERKEEGMNQPVTVDLFQRDFVELANALNEYTEYQKELTLRMEKERGMLQQIVAGISHDFRTPLTAAIGYLQLVDKNTDLEPQNQEYLNTALEKNIFLKELSDSFFELSSMERSEQEIALETIAIGKLLQEAILNQFEWIQEGDFQTEFEIPEKDIYAEGNEHCFKRILDNLFSNMQKYAQSRIHIALQEGEDHVLLLLENDKNEEEVDCSKVFEPFYRAASRTRNGSGLGLYVVKTLADKMGMEVLADTYEDMFRIRIVVRREKIKGN